MIKLIEEKTGVTLWCNNILLCHTVNISTLNTKYDLLYSTAWLKIHHLIKIFVYLSFCMLSLLRKHYVIVHCHSLFLFEFFSFSDLFCEHRLSKYTELSPLLYLALTSLTIFPSVKLQNYQKSPSLS